MKLKEMEDIGIFRTTESLEEFEEIFCGGEPMTQEDFFGKLGILGEAFIRISSIESVVQICNVHIQIQDDDKGWGPVEFLGLNRIRTASGETFFAVQSKGRDADEFDLRGIKAY